MQCVNPVYVRASKITVRCGKCFACVDNRHKQWAVRLQSEMDCSSTAYFVTLTFDDVHLLENTLEFGKREITLFLKRFRHFLKNPYLDISDRYKVPQIEGKTANFKYFLVGEFGSKNKRLHFHLLLFNVMYNKEKTVDILNLIWGNGLVHIGDIQTGGISYVTDYMLKSTEKSYMACSKGIGLSFLTDEMVKFHQANQTTLIKNRYGSYPMPRYFKDRIFTTSEKRLMYDKFIVNSNPDEVKRIDAYNNLRNRVLHKLSKK